ncbi:MAG: nucleotidyltransferase family protein [Alphaproteobacteria bacterium]|nr:nucleotidyltransferase family protein [Alphaproteobacteria bacterium]
MNGPSQAFVLAAGLGTRMRPLTDERPKPLVELAGRSLLERTLDHLEAACISDVVINTHYKADQIETRLKERTAPQISLSFEPELLETGGGIKKALPHFNGDFFVLGGDGFWEDRPDAENGNALHALAQSWRPEEMDILMLLQPVERMALTQGIGDYHLDAQGRAVRAHDKSGAYMFTGMRINKPDIFNNTPEGPFSYLDLMDEAQRKGRLYGLVYRGDWHHISTPEDVERVQAAILSRMAAPKRAMP